MNERDTESREIDYLFDDDPIRKSEWVDEKPLKMDTAMIGLSPIVESIVDRTTQVYIIVKQFNEQFMAPLLRKFNEKQRHKVRIHEMAVYPVINADTNTLKMHLICDGVVVVKTVSTVINYDKTHAALNTITIHLMRHGLANIIRTAKIDEKAV